MRYLVIVLFVLLLVLHQDFWSWGNGGLMFGFLPVGLAYHAVFSILCAGLGWLAIQYLWPHKEEQHAEGSDETGS